MGGPPYHPMPYHYAIFLKTGPSLNSDNI
jgi:hypothetical protein